MTVIEKIKDIMRCKNAVMQLPSDDPRMEKWAKTLGSQATMSLEHAEQTASFLDILLGCVDGNIEFSDYCTPENCAVCEYGDICSFAEFHHECYEKSDGRPDKKTDRKKAEYCQTNIPQNAPLPQAEDILQTLREMDENQVRFLELFFHNIADSMEVK